MNVEGMNVGERVLLKILKKKVKCNLKLENGSFGSLREIFKCESISI